MFVDEAKITVTAGHGGSGAASFRREKFVPKGGPDGGNGGKGGDVIMAADENVNTLIDFSGVHFWKATPGENGGAKQCSGREGADKTIRVPPGTLIYDDETGELLKDLGPGESFIVAKGGRGGWGNEHYKTPSNQTPRNAEPGEAGEQKVLRMELKLIADVGFVGMPNAGKSTLLASVTDATPKIGDYPFTTLAPQLGIAGLDNVRRLVLADIPGLIEGAAEGSGLGHEFLRHIERTRVLVHLIDSVPSDGSDPLENYKVIREELTRYSPALAEKPELIALNKIDLLEEEAVKKLAARFSKELRLGRDEPLMTISGATHKGTRELLERLWTMVRPEVHKWKDPAPAS